MSSPVLPAFHRTTSYTKLMFHSTEYRRPDERLGRSILVVGIGNSAAEIASELANAGMEVAGVGAIRRQRHPKKHCGHTVPILWLVHIPAPGTPAAAHCAWNQSCRQSSQVPVRRSAEEAGFRRLPGCACDRSFDPGPRQCKTGAGVARRGCIESKQRALDGRDRMGRRHGDACNRVSCGYRVDG